MSALAALGTAIAGYYKVLKKRLDKVDKMHSHMYGDEEKKGSVTRLRELEETVEDLEGSDLDINAIILQQQKAIKEALKPIYLQLEKKADQQLFDVQLQHIMEAIERIGRGT